MQQIEQNTLTKDFIGSVNHLVDIGLVKNGKELAEKLSWNASTMSEVMTGKRNVPRHISIRLQVFAASELQKQRDIIQGMDGARYENFLNETDRKLKGMEGIIRTAISFLVELEYLAAQEIPNAQAQAKAVETIRTAMAQLYTVIKDQADLNRLVNVVMAELKDKRIELHQRKIGIVSNQGTIGYYDRDKGKSHYFDGQSPTFDFTGVLHCWCGRHMEPGEKGVDPYYICPEHQVGIDAKVLSDKFYAILDFLSFRPEDIDSLSKTLKSKVETYLKSDKAPKDANKKVYYDKAIELVKKCSNIRQVFTGMSHDKKAEFITLLFGDSLYYKDDIFHSNYLIELFRHNIQALRDAKLFILNESAGGNAKTKSNIIMDIDKLYSLLAA